MTWADLADYVGVSTSSSDTSFVESVYNIATELVTKEIGDDTVSTTITEQAILLVGSELFHRRNAPNGVPQFTTPDGSVIRLAKDPMVAARPILQPFLSAGFA